MLSFADLDQLLFWVKGNALQMLVFKDPDLLPGGETVWEGPAIDCEANTAKDRKARVFQAPESGGKRVWIAEGR